MNIINGQKIMAPFAHVFCEMLTSNFDVIFSEHNILALEIAMHDTFVVTVSNTCRNAAHHEACLRLGQASAGVDVVEKVAIVSYLQHKIHLKWSLYETIDVEDVGVSDLLKSVYFSREKLIEKFSGCACLLNNLYCNLEAKI